MRAWLVQLPLAEARDAFAEWTPSAEPGGLGFGVGGHPFDRLHLLAPVGAWHDRVRWSVPARSNRAAAARFLRWCLAGH